MNDKINHKLLQIKFDDIKKKQESTLKDFKDHLKTHSENLVKLIKN